MADNALYINSINKTEYVIKAESPLRLGQLVLLSPSGFIGTVSEYLTRGLYKVKTKETPNEKDQGVALHSWWQIKQPLSVSVKVSNLFFTQVSGQSAALNVELNTTKQTDAGSLGWDLFYRVNVKQDWLHIMNGNDMPRKNTCNFYKIDCLWPTGEYEFQCTLYYKSNLVPFGSSKYTWNLKEPTSNLNAEVYI